MPLRRKARVTPEEVALELVTQTWSWPYDEFIGEITTLKPLSQWNLSPLALRHRLFELLMLGALEGCAKGIADSKACDRVQQSIFIAHRNLVDLPRDFLKKPSAAEVDQFDLVRRYLLDVSRGDPVAYAKIVEARRFVPEAPCVELLEESAAWPRPPGDISIWMMTALGAH